MWKLVLIFWLASVTTPETTSIEFVANYAFRTESGCALSTWTAYKRVGAAWAIINTPDGMNLVNVTRECRYTPKWAGRHHRNVGPVDR